MAATSMHKLATLPPGGCLRSTSGYFCRLPTGEIAFLPSLFRLPWHPASARIVDDAEIRRLMRLETVELILGILLLFGAIHYFFSDIMGFYMQALSLPLAVIFHLATLLAGAWGILLLNNAGMGVCRIALTKDLPKAPADPVLDILMRWSRANRVWLLSFLSGQRAANLNKAAVLLYLTMFICSGPLLILILLMLLVSGDAHTLDGGAGLALAFYIAISIWAFVESSLVLNRRMKAGRQRRLSRRTATQG